MRTRVLWALRVELHQSVDDDRGEMYLAKLAEVEARSRDSEEDNVGRRWTIDPCGVRIAVIDHCAPR